MYSLNEIEYRALSTEQVINSCFRPERAVIHALSIGTCDITEQFFIAVTFRLSYSLLSLLILAGLVGRLRSACGFRLGRRGLLIILEKLKQHLRIYEFGTDCGFCMGGARIFWNVFEEVNSETPEVQAPGRQAGWVRDSFSAEEVRVTTGSSMRRGAASTPVREGGRRRLDAAIRQTVTFTVTSESLQPPATLTLAA